MTDQWRQRINSPRIEALRQEVGRRPEALNEFWTFVANSGAPLIEDIPGDDDAACVTFIYRDWNSELDHVALVNQLVMSDFADNRLLRVGDTDVLALSLRVPKDTRAEYQLSPNDPLTPLLPAASGSLEEADKVQVSGEQVLDRISGWQPDPLNPIQHVTPQNEWGSELETGLVRSVLELPDAPVRRWSLPRQPHEPAADVRAVVHESTRGGLRRVCFQEVGTAPSQRLIVVLDGWSMINLYQMPYLLNRLHSAGLIPPTAAIYVDSGTSRMRICDYTGSSSHSQYLADEIVPLGVKHLGIVPDARRTVVCGKSLGGFTALSTGLRRPDVFGNILALGTATHIVVPNELPTGLIGLAEQVPADVRPRVHLQAGRLEVDRIYGGTIFGSNHEFYAGLRGMGFDVTFDEISCGHGAWDFSETIVSGLLRTFGANLPVS